MVQLMKSSDSGIADRGKAAASMEKDPVKLEIAEGFAEGKQLGPLHKRYKTLSSLDQQWGAGANAASAATTSQYNPLDEPSPLGLRLRKSPSLLDLIQMKLSQATPVDSEAGQCGNIGAEAKKAAAAASSMAEKLKASNFPASLLRIGKWEYKSRYEGDLVAKCYFAKHKLVWEVLEGGLKSKIEIQWSDIMAINASCPEEGPSTLNIVLSRLPLFFRETNPQPRKHTLWQATADFTDGQASLNRQHFLQCPQGLLIKHFEKLIQCDMRLNFLSRQPEPTLDSPFFDTRPGFSEPEDSKSRSFDTTENDKDSSFSGFEISPDIGSSSLKIKQRDAIEVKPREALSASSGGGSKSGLSGLKRSRDWDQIKVPGLHPSMSMSDLMNHIGNCLTEQIDPSSGDPSSEDVPGILEDIAEYLLSDSQSIATLSDEKSLMARVNSLCCLLQKDPSSTGQNPPEKSDPEIINDYKPDHRGDGSDGSGHKNPLGMSRKDSFSDLLLQLPRITSLPKFLFDISEESENHFQ